MKEFNTTGVCIPSKHYMVDLTERIAEIQKMVDEGKYFSINRARQYGKTTTLRALRQALKENYVVISLSFEGLGQSAFQTDGDLIQTFSRLLLDRHEFYGLSIPEQTLQTLQKFCNTPPEKLRLDELYRTFRRWIVRSGQALVLLIDEVDNASNNQVFLDFLGLLRAGYLSREEDDAPAFQSVILAGVTDVRYLKNKIRPEEQMRVNSPWNIATDFTLDMSLSEQGIRGMLEEYENDHHTGMDTTMMAKELRLYTSGYPFLVSRLCQLMDKEISKKTNNLSEAWTHSGIEEAVKMILSEDNTLFQSLTAKLENAPKLKSALRKLLMEGEMIPYNAQQKEIAQLHMYGMITNQNNAVAISNRIFETVLYNYFLSDEELRNNIFTKEANLGKNHFVRNGELDVSLILKRFIDTYHQVCGPLEEKFKEKDGRELFLLYLKPIINGTGNYYIEAQTRDQKRTDVIIDYLGKQYIIELKIWHGERYHEQGEQQILEYLDYYALRTGYMLSFNFNQKKETGVKEVMIDDKILIEGTV